MPAEADERNSGAQTRVHLGHAPDVGGVLADRAVGAELADARDVVDRLARPRGLIIEERADVVAKLVASDSKFADNFGFSVDICGDALVVGSIGHDDAGNGSGSAYTFLFDGSAWSESAKLAASDAAAGDEFGSDVGISGEHAIVGARLREATEVGASYAFDGVGASSWTDLGAALAGTLGAPLLMGAGTLCGDDSLVVTLSNAPPSASATLVLGLSVLAAPFKGGTLVPSPDLLVPGIPTGPTGTLAFPAILPAGLPPGFTFVLQYWIPDAGALAGFAASNALEGTTE